MPLPFHSIRIFELSKTLAGRLAGLLFADQGAEVFIERNKDSAPSSQDSYLDRGKKAVSPGMLNDTSSADVIIVDGVVPVKRSVSQIVLRITAAIPGDETYGYLAADCSEDLLNALVGFFTDMGTSSRLLGRDVIYTPLPLCSVYAGVNGAVATASAIIDRYGSGHGREITASRLAGGLSAIGALSLTSSGLPKHLAPVKVGGLPEGAVNERLMTTAKDAVHNPASQLWLEQRLAPLAAPFRASDGRLVLALAAPNRRLTQRFLKVMGIQEAVTAAGMVDESCYHPDAMSLVGRNLADSMALSFPMTSILADLLESAFMTKTALEWERELNDASIPCSVVQSWEEWKKAPHSRDAAIFAEVRGCASPQIGRSAWIASAQPYPPLECCRYADKIPPRVNAFPTIKKDAPSRLPLEGFTLVDFSNVVAGPSCGRMFAELGANVFRIETVRPQHSPTIMVTWAAETAVGKRSIILDTDTEAGRGIMRKIVAGADMILANKLDDQLKRLGIDSDSLKALAPSALGIQLSAYRGEKKTVRDNDPGYDPLLQGVTGIMTRFGPDGCPTYHGVASCVDYLCGYLGVWAGVTALAARENRGDGKGDWAETSLASAATLTQLLLQQSDEPSSARGPYATGNTAAERVYKLSDGWVFAKADRDMSDELATMTVKNALALLRERKIDAVPVQTCADLANRHRAEPSRTVNFEKRELNGWESECFAPTWFTFDDKPGTRPRGASRIGSDASEILAELGYTQQEIDNFYKIGAVAYTEWDSVTNN